jgi:tyrosine-protein kinase Etk/Wzc
MPEQTKEQINSNRSELWSLSLRDLFYKYVRFLPVFLLSVAFLLFAAYVYLRYATRIYQSGGTLLIKNEAQQGRSDKFEDVFVNNKALNIASEIEILKSRPLMERVVQKAGLQTSYKAIGKFITNNIYKQGPFLFDILQLSDSSSSFSLKIEFLNNKEFTVNNLTNKVRLGDVFKNSHGVFRLVSNHGNPGKEYEVSWTPPATIANEFARNIQVSPKQAGTGIVNISIQGTNPMQCADIINQLMTEYINYSKELKNKTSNQILDFITVQLKKYEDQLDSLQSDLVDFEKKHGIVDFQAQAGSYVADKSRVDLAINEQQQKINVVKIIEDYLRDKKNEYNRVVVPSSLGLEDVTLSEMVGTYNTAQLQRQALLDANVSAENPSVKVVEGQIEKSRESIQENLKNIKSSMMNVISSLQRSNTASESQIKEVPATLKQHNEKKRRVEGIADLYTYLREKSEETEISRASNIPNAQVIDLAKASGIPIKPNKNTIRILAILLGLALPAMFIFISEVLNDKISTRFDIEKITPAPILGEVGHSYSPSPLVVNKTTRSMVAEQFRIIRSNLQYIVTKLENTVIMVTSSFSGEGKSFVSTNLGAVLALAGKKTILLEFDIRKPKILAGLNISKKPGITNYMVGKAKLEDLIIGVPDQENLFVLPCGPIPPNPSELLLDEKISEMFTWLRERFDIIIIDTAPVGMVSDAQTLAKQADCTLYLVRQGHTFKKQVALIDEFYQDNKLPKVSIVINDVKIKPGYGYYGYGRYGYGYGYGYGGYYEEEHPPKSFFDKLMAFVDIRKLFRKRRGH